MISSAEEFVRLRTSEDPEVYDRAYREPAPMEVWLEVIEKYPDMRRAVAGNKSVPLEILRILIDDPDWRIRATIAGKRKLSQEMFESLAADPDEGVRSIIVYNPKVPLSVLRTLANDESPDIAEKAQERIAAIEQQ